MASLNHSFYIARSISAMFGGLVCWALVWGGPPVCGCLPACQFWLQPLEGPVTPDVLAGGGNFGQSLARCLSSLHRKHLSSILRASFCFSENWGCLLGPRQIASILVWGF